MNEFLAQYYGTTQPTVDESAEKVAQAELFNKFASENGIDLDTLSNEQVQALWDATFGDSSEKTAAEEPAKEEKKEEKSEEKDEKKDEKKEDGGKPAFPFAEKKAAAEAELAEKQASAEKFAEADFLGRVMAHAYVDELKKISSAGGQAVVEEKVAGKASELAARFGSKAKDLGAKASGMADKHPVATAAGAGAAGGMVGSALFGKKEKKASALDELAIAAAVEKVAASGFDKEEAAERLAAVMVLTGGNLPSGTKIASAGNDVEKAVEIRSLELLEAAGYPIEWAV